MDSWILRQIFGWILYFDLRTAST